MLRELGPDNPIADGKALIIGAFFFLICGLNYKRIADYTQKQSGCSDESKRVGLLVMRPTLFIMAALALYFAYVLLKG